MGVSHADTGHGGAKGPGGVDSLTRMDRPPADPAKLLAFWMEWEKGETTPGTVMKNLKNGGLREILEGMVGGDDAAA